MFCRLIIVLTLIINSHSITFSQDQSSDSIFYSVKTKDGNEYIGKIKDKNDERIILLTNNLGQITIKVSSIVSIHPIEAKLLKHGEYWFSNPQSTRYFWAPNSYGLEKGEGYYQNVWILFN